MAVAPKTYNYKEIEDCSFSVIRGWQARISKLFLTSLHLCVSNNLARVFLQHHSDI
jgi:hypothetical protein